MSDVIVNPEEAAAKARQILEADVNTRVEAVRILADAANESDAADQRLKEATAAHERAWSAAINAGWNEKDLRATGVRAPGGPAPRARKRRTSTPVTQSASAE